jgi:GH35 family endo-1,4-beta-xylanase
MGDMAEIFNDMKDYKKMKRADNTRKSTALLKRFHIEFESKNNGAHLIVSDYNFWPSTGLFENRITKRTGRGVYNLIKKLKEK